MVLIDQSHSAFSGGPGGGPGGMLGAGVTSAITGVLGRAFGVDFAELMKKGAAGATGAAEVGAT